MTRLRDLALCAILACAAPGVASASTASFAFSGSAEIGITAPGATIDLFDSFAFGDSFAAGAATSSLTTSPDPLIFALPLMASAEGAGTATDPGGFAEAFGVASFTLDVINETLAPITGELSWDLSVDTDATAVSGPLFADALAFAFMGLFADILGAPHPIADVEIFAETDALFGPFGPDSDADDGTVAFTLAPGESLSLDFFASGDGFAEVVVVPLPASVLFGLFGFAALASLRLRRT